MDTEKTAENPWLRPGFLVSCCVVAVVVVLVVYIAVARISDDDPGRPDRHARARPAVPAAPKRTTASGDARICGLPGPGSAAATVGLRSASWRYGRATAYPTSTVYGPARTSAQGYRYCFQRSPGGALFAAANSLAFDNSSVAEARAWWDYILADGRYRQARLSDNYVAADPTARIQIIGYRIISYTDAEAWVDVVARASNSDGAVVVSVVSHLVWQRGDWLFSTDELESTNVARISDLTDYTAWSAE